MPQNNSPRDAQYQPFRNRRRFNHELNRYVAEDL
jgi:hypothetical protein